MKRFNISEILWLLILCGFSVYIAQLLLSGAILNFVHPRSVKFATFTMIFIAVLAVYQLFQIQKSSARRVRFEYFLFLLPLLLGFAVQPDGVNEELAVVRGVNVSSIHTDTVSIFTRRSQRDSGYQTEDVLVVDDLYFDDTLNEIRYDTEAYLGQKIELYGFVYREDHYDDDMVFISRLLISCCAADAMITGILVRHEALAEFQTFEWVDVSGVVTQGSYYDAVDKREYLAPIIELDSIQFRERPSNRYVYPSNYSGPSHDTP